MNEFYHTQIKYHSKFHHFCKKTLKKISKPLLTASNKTAQSRIELYRSKNIQPNLMHMHKKASIIHSNYIIHKNDITHKYLQANSNKKVQLS